MMPMLPFTPSPSIVSAYARVDKATSEFLNCPDWRINIAICDTINSKHWLAKDYIKALRARLQHKNPNVQLLALTLLETLVKNCSEHIHAQIGERKILHEMIKIVKKKTHMRVREKILVLIDTWQEAFSGRGGKTAQYHHAYEELRRYGVEFPRRSPNMVPIITPPANHQSFKGAGSSTRHPMGSSTDNLSLTTLESMRNVVDLLSEMLQAVDAKDLAALKDEVIVDLTDQCRSNQKKLGQMLASTIDEELLRQGLQFNDMLQYILEKHDAVASGSPVPVQPSSSSNHTPDAHKAARLKDIESTEVDSKSSIVVSDPIIPSSTNEIEEERKISSPIVNRHYETQTIVTENGAAVFVSKSNEKSTVDPALTIALVLSDPPAPANKKSAEDMIDFLSIALSPAQASTSNIGQASQSSTIAESQTQVPLNSYVVPWAQAQAQAQPQPEFETQPAFQTVSQQSDYIPPPWAPTPGYYCNPYASLYSTASYYNGPSSGAGLNPYIPSYRLFEDLNVLGNLRTSSTPGTSGPSMLGARK